MRSPASPETILALDLARVAGAAWDASGGMASRAFTLGKPGDVPAHLVELERVVGELIDEARPDLVSIERDFSRGAGSRTLSSYHAVAMMVAERRGVAVMKKIVPSQARKLALGYGGGDKSEVERLARFVLGVDLAVLSNDEIDAIILLEATHAWCKQQAQAKAFKKAAQKAQRKPARRLCVKDAG